MSEIRFSDAASATRQRDMPHILYHGTSHSRYLSWHTLRTCEGRRPDRAHLGVVEHETHDTRRQHVPNTRCGHPLQDLRCRQADTGKKYIQNSQKKSYIKIRILRMYTDTPEYGASIQYINAESPEARRFAGSTATVRTLILCVFCLFTNACDQSVFFFFCLRSLAGCGQHVIHLEDVSLHETSVPLRKEWRFDSRSLVDR